MKKRLVSVLATLLCVMLCAFGFAACDNDSDKNEDGTQSVAVKTVTSEQWKQAMESPKKFVIEMKQGEMTSTIKIDGDKRMQVFGNMSSLYVKEVTGDKTEYFSYSYDGTKCEKTVIDENDYSTTSLYAEITTYFKDDFASFAYADGKYTAASLDKTSSPLDCELTNVEATFENGALKGMKFVVEGSSVEIKEIGTTNITIPTEYVDSTAPTTEVTAEEWAKIIMESADNFTYDNTRNQPGSTATQTMTMTVKIDGDKRMQMMNGEMQILVKEGTEYYQYAFSNGVWTKSSIEEARYEQSSTSAALLSYFRDDFASFTYADGKYTAATLDKTTTMNSTLNNVEVTFENGALVALKFTIGSGNNVYEVKDVGTTEITLPTDYTDNTTSSQNLVAGKTFVFKDVTCKSGDADASSLAVLKSQNSGATITFNTDGTAIATVPKSTVQKMTYTQNGATITVVVVEINGEVVEVGEQPPMQMSLVNGKLVHEETIWDAVFTFIYELQTAE